jgi:hypothetical protein
MNDRFRSKRVEHFIYILVAVVLMFPTIVPAQAASQVPQNKFTPTFSNAVAFDVSKALRDLPATTQRQPGGSNPSQEPREIRPDRGPDVQDQGFSGDGALQGARSLAAPATIQTIPDPCSPSRNLQY